MKGKMISKIVLEFLKKKLLFILIFQKKTSKFIVSTSRSVNILRSFCQLFLRIKKLESKTMFFFVD